MDTLTAEQRSEVMSRIRGKDTRPEMLVRRYLHSRGLRYRIHNEGLPGKPDISFTPRLIAVFVHGCFWHGHYPCPRASIPKTRSDFWSHKINSTKERDLRVADQLKGLGWDVMVIWQCEISPSTLEALYEKIAARGT
jgi:DNA mismatch endonuclease (patch repair protein)